VFEVPVVETPLNVTVMRFTQDGMPVKLMAVPDVDACAVPETRGYKSTATPPV
jgi:hypothetical protein